MWQGELFAAAGQPDERGFVDLCLPDADLRLCQGFLSAAEAERAYAGLRADVDWQQESYALYGRDVPAPRLTAWYGDPDRVYTYSGVRHQPSPWTGLLGELRDRVSAAVDVRFNSVLLNYYRDGRDSVAWHSDDEADLGARPTIASLSLGVARVFQLKHSSRSDLERVDLQLLPGSLLIMAGDCQRCWRHQLPKRKNLRSGRINLTFRQVGRPLSRGQG